MEPSGYPGIILYAALLIGIPLAMTKPFKAFLMVAFMMAAADADAFTFTRTGLLGSYFNANDACLLIAVTAVLVYRIQLKRPVCLPPIAKWILAVLLFGYVQSCISMGAFNYEVLRSLRWAITLPAFFIIAATMVTDEEKVRQVLLVLFFGSLVSALEHIFFVRSRIDMGSSDISFVRTIAFRSPGLWFLIAAVVHIPRVRGLNRRIVLVGLVLFAISILLNQSRSLWISSLVTLVPVLLIYFRHKNLVIKVLAVSIVTVLVCALVVVIMGYLTPDLKPQSIIEKRFSALQQSKQHTITRKLSFEREMMAWRDSTLVFGCGLSYHIPYAKEMYKGHRVAWGHLGHVTILAQLGLIGLLLYSVFLPKTVIQTSIRLWQHTSEETRFLGLLAGSCIISCWFCFFMSDSFLIHHASEGIIFGAAWRHSAYLRQTAQEAADGYHELYAGEASPSVSYR